MKKIFLNQSLLLAASLAFLVSCEVAERTETKAESEAKVMVRDSTASTEENVVATNLVISDFVPKNTHPEAGFEQLTPKNKQLLKPGDISFTFNTKKFPFVDGHSVRISVENGTKKFVFNAKDKINLPEGVFLCASYLCDGNGVSLKNSKSFQLTQLNVGVDEKKDIDMLQPMLFLNLPSYKEGESVLVDFMLYNVELSKKGNRVRLSIDDKTEIYLESWKTVKINGLAKGKHTVLIELINAKGKLYDGIYANDNFEFEVE